MNSAVKINNDKTGETIFGATCKQSKAEKIGEIKKNLAGIAMKIIAYRSNNDIDVQLDNGGIIRGTTYRRFSLGKVGV